MIKKIIKKFKRSKEYHIKSEGVSMRPLLYPHDIVYFKKTSFEKSKIDDIVMVQKNGKTFTHRIIYKSSTSLITKGDGNLQSDGKIHRNNILGKAYQVKRDGKIMNLEDVYLLQSTIYFQEITKIIRKLDHQRITYVVLKGLPLYLYFQHTHPKRIYLDCDILIENDKKQEAERILIANGYKKIDTSLSKFQKNLQDKEPENAYGKIINGFMVVFDIHTEVVFMMTQLGRLEVLYPQRFVDELTKEFLETKQQVKINYQSFYMLSTNCLLLYLALHFFHHNFKGAFRLDFLDMIIRYSRNQPVRRRLAEGGFWTSQNDFIKKYKLQNFVYSVFSLLKKCYQTPIPSSFLKSIQPSNFQLYYLSSTLNHPLSAFNDESRTKGGIQRFKNLFFLSPNPFWYKLFVLFNLQVLYSIFWISQRRLFSFLSSLKKSYRRLSLPFSF